MSQKCKEFSNPYGKMLICCVQWQLESYDTDTVDHNFALKVDSEFLPSYTGNYFGLKMPLFPFI